MIYLQAALAGGVVMVADQAHLEAALSGGGTVTFGSDGTVLLTNTITISADSVLNGTGHTVAISGNSAVRVFKISPGVSFTLIHLSIVDGRHLGADGGPDLAGEDASGGGVEIDAGTLNVSDCAFLRNSAVGGNGGPRSAPQSGRAAGGAICNRAGTVNVTNSSFTSNSVVSGVGANAYGGALCNQTGTVSLAASVFSGNSCMGGHDELLAYAESIGGSAFGGAIYGSGGTVNIRECRIGNNSAAVLAPWIRDSSGNGNIWGGSIWGGGLGQDGGMMNLTGTTVSSNLARGGGAGWGGKAGAGVGGGAFNNGTLRLTNSCFLANSARGGSASSGANGMGGGLFNIGDAWMCGALVSGNNGTGGESGGAVNPSFLSGDGKGGGIWNGGTLCLTASTILSNATAGADGTYGYRVGSGTGYGGGVCNEGSLFATNDTFFGNVTQGGAPGDLAFSGNAYGGGCYDRGAMAVVAQATFFGNQALGGPGALDPPHRGLGLGGAISSGNAAVLLRNSILAASSSGSNCWGTITDGGGNLSSDASGAFSAPKSLNNIDPVLGPLDDYGGLTPTMPLLAGSPAIDGGETGFCPNTDQRGNARPFGGACDIGAFESSPPFTIRGRVIAPSGAAGIHLTAGTASTQSSDDGRYVLRELSAGSQVITASGAGLVFVPGARLVTLGPDLLGVDFNGYATRSNGLVLVPTGTDMLLLVFAGTSGQTHRVERSTNLVDWTAISTNQVGADGLFELLVAPDERAWGYFFRTRGQ